MLIWQAGELRYGPSLAPHGLLEHGEVCLYAIIGCHLQEETLSLPGRVGDRDIAQASQLLNHCVEGLHDLMVHASLVRAGFKIRNYRTMYSFLNVKVNMKYMKLFKQD